MRPHEFIPERWTTRPELVREKGAYAPFSLGGYNCIGRGLALMTLRGTVARLVMAMEGTWEFAGDNTTNAGQNTTHPPTQSAAAGAGGRFEDGVKSQFVTLPGRLDVVFRKGERRGEGDYEK